LCKMSLLEEKWRRVVSAYLKCFVVHPIIH
jgi:hypothetical protein